MKTAAKKNHELHLHALPASGSVDREAGVIRGVNLAEIGPFRTRGRGEFNQDSFDAIKKLADGIGAKGLKARITHPRGSKDGLFLYVGRFHNLRQEGIQFKGDLHFSKLAFRQQVDGGGISVAEYLMERADEDSDSFATSFHLQADEVFRLDGRGKRILDSDRKPLPPIWIPTALNSSDIVDTGDAVRSGFLSVEEFSFDDLAEHLLSSLPSNTTDDEIRVRFNKFLDSQSGQLNPQKEKEEKTMSEEFDYEKLGNVIGSTIDKALAPINQRLESSEKQNQALSEKLIGYEQKNARAMEVQKMSALCAKHKLSAEDTDKYLGDESMNYEKLCMDMCESRMLNNALPEEAGGNPGGGENSSGGKTGLSSSETSYLSSVFGDEKLFAPEKGEQLNDHTISHDFKSLSAGQSFGVGEVPAANKS